MKMPNIYHFFGQNDGSASQHTVYVPHSFSAKKQNTSDFMAAGSIQKSVTASTLSPSICHEGWAWIP